MSVSAQNMEDAAAIAQEYISSLDNLPSEIQFLLQEIRHKEAASYELQQEITRDQARYTRHGLRSINASNSNNTSGGSTPTPSSTTPTTPNPASSVSSSAGGTPMTAKDLALPAKISQNYQTLDQLSDAKIKLAERIVELITRARARLEVDVARVLALTGETLPMDTISSFGGHDIMSAGGGGAGSGSGTGISSGGGRTSAASITESLRNAMASPLVAIGAAVSSAGISAYGSIPEPVSAPPPTKRRKLGLQASQSIKAASPAPAASTGHRSGGGGGGGGSGGRVRRRPASSSIDDDEESVEPEPEPEPDYADTDMLEEEGEGEEDKNIYCFCRKMSYGKMIGCDNDDCPYQWFHLACVDLKEGQEPEHFYCSECTAAGFGVSSGPRRGRKKAGA